MECLHDLNQARTTTIPEEWVADNQCDSSALWEKAFVCAITRPMQVLFQKKSPTGLLLHYHRSGEGAINDEELKDYLISKIKLANSHIGW
jgi:hypothetical protein